MAIIFNFYRQEILPGAPNGTFAFDVATLMRYQTVRAFVAKMQARTIRLTFNRLITTGSLCIPYTLFKDTQFSASQGSDSAAECAGRLPLPATSCLPAPAIALFWHRSDCRSGLSPGSTSEVAHDHRTCSAVAKVRLSFFRGHRFPFAGFRIPASL